MGLGDEMREHHRLRELNVLSAAKYEASNTRISKAYADCNPRASITAFNGR